MLSRFRKIELLILLIPYLFYAVVGLAGHNHNHKSSHQCSTCIPVYNNYISNQMVSDGDLCPVCYVQDAFSSYGLFILPSYDSELAVIDIQPGKTSYIQLSVLLFTPTRAPPATIIA
jgi:hypothetical protein